MQASTQQSGEGLHASVDEITEITGDPNSLADNRNKDSSQLHDVESGHRHHDVSDDEIAHNMIKVLVDNMTGKLESAPPSDFVAQQCIYKVHEKFRKINEFAYTPVMASIGPFHRGNGTLQAMEKCKLIYMRDMLSRAAAKIGCSWSTILEECVVSIKKIEKEARSCYSEPINLGSNEFVEMMVVDGLFIIELIRRRDKEVNYDHDPVFSSTWNILSLIRDMSLLENQIPIQVLDRLFTVPALHEELRESSFTLLALYFFNPSMPRDDEVIEQYSSCEGKHLLDLLAKTFHPPKHRSAKDLQPSWDFIPSAIELKNSGVEFKMGSIEGSFLDIRFSNGVMEIPPIIVQDNTESLLRNLIASEQCSDGDVDYFTSYASLMDDLINSGSDVALLRKQGIIKNYLGNDEDVSNLFNKLCCELTINSSCYSELYDQVNTYYRKRRHIWRAVLMRDYFNSPWAIISVVAAVLLLFLTLTATIFAILSFSIHHS